MKNQITITLLSILILTFSCKKESTSITPTPSASICQLASTLENDTSYSGILYNTNGTVSQVITKEPSSDSTIISLSYNNNIVNLTTGGQPIGTYYLNSKGFADSSVIDFGGFINIITYNTFDNNGYLISQNETSTILSTVNVTNKTFTYSNGNLSEMTEDIDGSTTTYSYTYFTDKTNNIANADQNNLFLGKQSANLIKQEKVDGMVSYDYTYTFDSKGNVIDKKSFDSNGGINTINYSWKCN